MSNKTLNNYSKLQQQIDQVIGKIGLDKTIFLLSSFIDSSDIAVSQPQKFQMLSRYLITECIRVFELNDKLFFTSNIQEYRDARMVCYHLLKKYTGLSYSKIAEDFGLTKRNILYGAKKCEEKLSVPYYYEGFVEKYDLLESTFLQFISKLSPKVEEPNWMLILEIGWAKKRIQKQVQFQLKIRNTFWRAMDCNKMGHFDTIKRVLSSLLKMNQVFLVKD